MKNKLPPLPPPHKRTPISGSQKIPLPPKPKGPRIAVIVARFQTAELTMGHRMLLHHAYFHADHVLIVVGSAPTRLCTQNPLSFKIRQQMLKAYLGPLLTKTTIAELKDLKSDVVWSSNLDKLIAEEVSKHTYVNVPQSTKKKNSYRSLSDGIKPTVKIYTGRQGFNEHYTGTYLVEPVSFNLDAISATQYRQQLHKKLKNNADWRAGVIYASAHKYPTSFQTVDVAIINHDKKQVLLGKKPGEKKYRFVGGHVDVKDQSLEDAAKREAMEETGNIETDNYKYLGSFRVDDWRYKRSLDGILTALFVCDYIFGTPIAKDDIVEVKWFKFKDLAKTSLVEPEHIPLMDKLIQHLLLT